MLLVEPFLFYLQNYWNFMLAQRHHVKNHLEMYCYYYIYWYPLQ